MLYFSKRLTKAADFIRRVFAVSFSVAPVSSAVALQVIRTFGESV